MTFALGILSGLVVAAIGCRFRTRFLRAKADEALRLGGLTEAQVKALEGADVGVFDIDLETGNSNVSAVWLKLMGMDPEMGDQNPQEVFLSRIHPDDLPCLREADERCFRGESETSKCDYRVRFGSGDRWKWMRSEGWVVDWSSAGTPLRFVGTQRDVTPEVEAREQLMASEERFRLIFDNAPVGMAVISEDGVFLNANQALADLLGYDVEHIKTALRGRDIISRQALGDIMRAIGDAKAEGKQLLQFERDLNRSDGSRAWCLFDLAWTPDLRTGEDLYIVQIIDMTEKHSLDRLKNEFVSTVSHELKTPLTSMRAALSLLQQSGVKLEGTSARLLEIAMSNADRLTALVNDILDLERIESGRMQFDIQVASACEAVREAAVDLEPFADGLGVSIETELPDDDVLIRADRPRLAQVFNNLVSNACKFSHAAGIVTVKAVPEEDFVRFLVIDRGVGIPLSFRKDIFSPFSQADGTDTREKGGTGLGLNITKKLIERMGGEIGFDSAVGQGTVFWFTCPLATPEEATPDQSAARA